MLILITFMCLKTGSVTAMAEDGQPKTLNQQLRSAAAAQNMTEVVQLVNAGADPKTLTLDMSGSSFLWLAISRDNYNQLNAIPLLVAAGLRIDHKNNVGDMPLHHAANQLATNAIVQLIELGADKNVRNSFGKTPLDNILEHSQHEEPQIIAPALKAMLTTASPAEIQHVIPGIIAFKIRRTGGVVKDVGAFIAAQLVPQVVAEKLALAQRYLPNVPEAELRDAITVSVNRVIKNSPRIKAAVQEQIDSPTKQ